MNTEGKYLKASLKQYLPKGIYKQEDLLHQKVHAKETIIDVHQTNSVHSEISEDNPQEQNHESYYNYVRLGDPYIMGNGEISSTGNTDIHSDESNSERIFHFRKEMINTADEENSTNQIGLQEDDLKNINMDPVNYFVTGYYPVPNVIPFGYFPTIQPTYYILPNQYYPQLIYPQIIP